jgi:hypothetical protein
VLLGRTLKLIELLLIILLLTTYVEIDATLIGLDFCSLLVCMLVSSTCSCVAVCIRADQNLPWMFISASQ